jgi:hypothetical protein
MIITSVLKLNAEPALEGLAPALVNRPGVSRTTQTAVLVLE